MIVFSPTVNKVLYFFQDGRVVINAPFIVEAQASATKGCDLATNITAFNAGICKRREEARFCDA